MSNPQYLNARQIFEQYGIPRAALGQLAFEGRVNVKTISTDVAVTKLYSVADLERVLNTNEGEENEPES